VIAFLFPGQGAQQVGMGKALADAYPEARAVFAEADAAFDRAAAAHAAAAHDAALAAPEKASGSEDPARAFMVRDLSQIIFDGPEEHLMLTEITQPAILTVSVAAARVLAAHGLQPSFVAGHSLGEYSANVVAGTLSFGDAVRVVQRRGRYMQEAVPLGVGAMAAILGLDAEGVRRACEEAAQGEVVTPANLNGPGQIAIAGHAGAVQRASERARALGARRAVPLSVSAPFHCDLMKSAEARLEPELRDLRAHDPRVPIVANVDARLKRHAWSAIDALVQQVSSPVRWQDVVERLASEGVSTYVEVGPGTVLSGLVRKIHKQAHVIQFGSPEDLGAVIAACSISAGR
jgi:[acyl-carrier-protein] S-malonyltransferase